MLSLRYPWPVDLTEEEGLALCQRDRDGDPEARRILDEWDVKLDFIEFGYTIREGFLHLNPPGIGPQPTDAATS